jgi:hypothetical protein
MHRKSDHDAILARLRERAKACGARHPAKPADVQAAERALGFELPSFFRRVLLEVANGGFGPGNDLLGVPPDGYVDDDLDAPDLVTAYQRGREAEPPYRAPRGIIYLCNWGCATWSHLDCLSPEPRILTREYDDEEVRYVETSPDLSAWLLDWADGGDGHAPVYEVTGKREGINPFTKKPMTIEARRLKGVPIDLTERG